MSFVSEFREFAVKGNVMDLAVGVIIGGAFGKIVSSLVDDIIMPFISMLTGGYNFKELKYVITPNVVEVKDAGGKIITEAVPEAAIRYGMFIQNILDFLIIALCIFMMIKAINKLKREKPVEQPVAGPTQEELLTDIRDLLRKERNI